MRFLIENWTLIVPIVFVIGIVIYSSINKTLNLRLIFKTALDTMLLLSLKNEIEKKDKMGMVIDDVYGLIPTGLQCKISKNVIKFFLQKLYEFSKGKINKKSQHLQLMNVISTDIASNIAKKAVEELSTNLLNTDHAGNYDIVGNETIKSYSNTSKSNIEVRLKAEARAMFDEKLKTSGLLSLNVKKFF